MVVFNMWLDVDTIDIHIEDNKPYQVQLLRNTYEFHILVEIEYQWEITKRWYYLLIMGFPQ